MSETTAPPVTIIEFLIARIDEDEKDFTLPRPHNLSSADAYHGAHRYDCAALLVGGIGTHDLNCDCGYPARMLKDVAAKRKIVESHRYVSDGKWFDCSECGQIGVDWTEHGYSTPACDPLKIFAAVYSDHPDYQREWAV